MRRLLMLLVLVSLGLAGCSGYRDPTLHVLGARVSETTDEAVRLDFDLELANPNDEPLELLRFEYVVRVDGVKVYEGKRAAEATLNRRASRTAALPAVVRRDRAGWDAGVPDRVAYVLQGTLHYVTPGEIAEVLLDTGLRRPKVRFRAEGQCELATP